MNTRTQAVLVTGGAGYIGSHTCKLLQQRGYLPVVIDNLVYGHRSFVQWGPFYEGDINDSLLLDQIFSKHQPVAVIHFAAYAYVGESVLDPQKYYLNNVAGTLALLKAMNKNGCKRIVFSSSCATYGVPDVIPINEQEVQNPINPYGRSKLMVEDILRDYDQAYGFQSVSLRYFNAAGCDPEGIVGEDHQPETHLIPLTIYAALGKLEKITVYGTDYETEDGTAVRDYVHVNDLADAHIKSIEYLIDGGQSMALNLGTGDGVSVKQIIDAVKDVTGIDFKVHSGDRRTGDPPALVADALMAKSTLAWHPNLSAIENIVSDAWRWHKKRHG